MNLLINAVINYLFIGVLVILMVCGYILYGIIFGVIMFKKHARYKISALLLAVVIFTCTVLSYRFFIPMNPKNTKELTIDIKKGMSTGNIAYLLKKNDIIRNKTEFKAVAKFFKLDKKLKAGRYNIPYNFSLYKIFNRLSKGKMSKVTMVITEGMIIEDIAKIAHEKCGVDSAEFVKLANNRKLINKLGINQNSLEGYLFPDTYNFVWGVKPEYIIKTMVSRFNEIYDSIEKKNHNKCNFNKHQIITIASIVERETGISSERKKIAGVFLNRLKINMPLGADPTVRYAIKKFKGPLKVSELNIKSPYNTRKYRGLPPGPICNPGFYAIDAVFNPIKTDDLYFVAKEDGSHGHYFSKTLNQHVRAKQKARKRKNRK